MGKIIFILGGVRSGKSTYAITCARKRKGLVAFIATCRPLDKEMRARIQKHQAGRPQHWHTFEEPLRLTAALKKIDKTFSTVLIDCLTLYVSNLLLKGYGDPTIEKKIEEAIGVLKKAPYASFIVSNEVGLGIVPAHELGRKFRDIAGKINQRVAQEADTVVFMVSGLPMCLKGGGRRDESATERNQRNQTVGSKAYGKGTAATGQPYQTAGKPRTIGGIGKTDCRHYRQRKPGLSTQGYIYPGIGPRGSRRKGQRVSERSHCPDGL